MNQKCKNVFIFKSQKMQKSPEQSSGQIRKKDKLIEIFCHICCEFRNQRISHGFIIFVCIWNRILMGTCLNITRLLKQKNSILNFIDQLWITLISNVTHSQLQNFNLIFLLLFLLISIMTFIWVLFARQSKRKPIIITILITQLNYLLLRYFINILFSITHFKLQTCLQVLTIASILFIFLFQALFLVISTSSKIVNQNLLTYHKKKLIPIKSILVLILVILTQTSIIIQNQLMGILINGLHLGLSLVSLYSICSQFLYHSKFTETVYESAVCFQITISFCVFVALLTENPLFIQNIVFLIFSIMFFICIAGHQYIGYRNTQIIFRKENSQLNTKNYLQLLTHFLSDNSEGGQQQCLVNSLKYQHQENCNNPACVCQLSIISQDEKQELQKMIVLNKLNSIIQSDRSFQVILQSCYLKLIFFQSYTDLIFKLNSKKTVNLSILNIIQYECLKKQIEKYLQKRKNQDNSINTQLIQKQDGIIVDFFNSIKSQSINKQLFWFKLNRNNILSASLQESFTHYLRISHKCDQIIEQIFILFPYSKLLLDFIVFYESLVKLKSQLSKELKSCLRNCTKIALQRAKLLKQNQFKLDLMLFQRETVCFESKIQESNMGIIYNVSKNIQQTFGYQRDLIIGQNINVIMPKSMQKQHDFILQSWRATCSWQNFHKIRHIFAMTNDRTCFETVIYLKIIQREQSVNILATFLKANENDYMLVNENGIIDGIGLNLKYLLGEDVVKLPFSFICERAGSIMEDCRTKNIKRTSKLHLYHVKGLEQVLDSYQQSRYQIVHNTENIEVSEKIFRVKDRLLKLCFSYQPYWMGRKFFVIFKLIEKSDEKSDETKKRKTYNTSNAEEIQSQPEKEIINEGSSDIQTFNEPNSNIQTPSCETSVSNELIFLDLHQRSKNISFEIKSKRLFFHLFIILIIFFFDVILLGIQQSRIIIQDSMTNLLDIQRFSEKTNSLNLAYSDFISIKTLNNGQLFQFYLSKAQAQLTIVQQAIANLNYKQLSSNVHTQLIQNFSQNQIEFNEYYIKHLNIYKHLKQNVGFLNPQINTLIQFLSRNKINQNVKLASDQIRHKLNSLVVQSRIFLAFYLLILLIFGFLTLKIVQVETLQSTDILKILLMVSEKNCQACNNYYKNMNHFLEKISSELRHHDNIPRRIEFCLTQNNRSVCLQNLYIDPERGIGKKSLIRGSSIKSPVWICFVSIIFLVSFLLKWNMEEQIFLVQIHEREESISLMEQSRKIILNYTNIKQIVFSETVNQYIIESLRQYLLQSQKEEKQKVGFMSTVLQILRQNEVNFTFYKQTLNQIEQKFLCQIAKLQNQILYRNICERNISKGYEKLKLFTAHSFIKQSINEIVSLILKNQNNDWPLYQEMFNAIDQIVTLQFLSIRRFTHILNLKIVQANKFSRQNIYLLYFGFYFLLLLLFFSDGYLVKRANNKMNLNCGKLLIVPQIVWKKTRGAMKSIESIVNY